MKQKKFLFACGGTGGHVFPAMAIAESLKALGITDISFAGRADSMESRLVSPHWEYDVITAVPLHRGALMSNLSLPFVYAAGRMGIPVYIQEQNAVAGVANKVGSRYAKKIFVSSTHAAKVFPEGKTQVFGNPVRKLPSKESLARPMEFPEGKKCVLVLGGSQGAAGINTKIENSISKIAARSDVAVLWQAGAKKAPAIADRVHAPNVFVKGFVDNVYAFMAYADVIVSRAGASTLAEILAFGKPSVLLPYPFATANHHEFNARAVENAGAALVELDDEPDHLWEKVENLLANTDELNRMAKAAQALGMPDAADKIAKVIFDAECAK